MSPAVSWSWPSCGVIVSTASCLKVSGSEPYDSTFARLVACVWLNCPKISAEPPTIGPWLIDGNEITCPSSTTARSSSGEPLLAYLSNILVVRVPNALPPALLKLMFFCQNVVLCWGVAPADLIMLPSTVDLSSTNLRGAPVVPPDRPHATIWFAGLSQTSGV